VRTIRFDAEKGFFLNGQHVEIKGTCNHQDHAGVGTAMPDRLQYFRVARLKEMGSNAYRTSHNPPTPELLDVCDELGMLVMDENRRMDDSPAGLRELEAMIRRDRNHPGIFIWSIGNEEGTIQGSDTDGARIATAMQNRAHELDPTRPVTVAMNGGWGRGFSKVIDVMGFNYIRNGSGADRYHRDFPARPCIGTEEASTFSTRGEYANDTNACYIAAYDDNAPGYGATAERWWRLYVARPWLAGAFVWTGFDYRGEPSPFRQAYSSQFGIMDTCGFPKDNFFYYQAWWTDKRVLHLLPHWNWAGKEGQEIDVRCFSNCEAVELFLNGKSLGKQDMPRNSHLRWKVNYTPGTLLANGWSNGKVVAREKVETTGPPVAVKLVPDRAEINADGEDVSLVLVAATDAVGRFVPVAENTISFAVTGGTIIGVGNGHPNSTESDKANERKLFNGLGQVIVQSPKNGCDIHLTASSPGMKPATVTIKARPAKLRPSVPTISEAVPQTARGSGDDLSVSFWR
jgi:beta-galactosidase